jgi:signal transduction histidine kinase
LSAALHDLGRSVVDGHARVSFDIDEATAQRVSQPAQEEMFRVTQECLRNAVKHARADRVTVRLATLPDGTARLEIDDDGAGFDAAATVAEAEEGHLGLQLIAHAARRCGARLAVSSRPGHGTRFRMEVAPA